MKFETVISKEYVLKLPDSTFYIDVLIIQSEVPVYEEPI